MAACGQAASEAPSLGRYLPCPDPKYNYVSSAGQGGLWKLLHCGHSKVSQVMCVPGVHPLKCLHKSPGPLPLELPVLERFPHAHTTARPKLECRASIPDRVGQKPIGCSGWSVG